VKPTETLQTLDASQQAELLTNRSKNHSCSEKYSPPYPRPPQTLQNKSHTPAARRPRLHNPSRWLDTPAFDFLLFFVVADSETRSKNRSLVPLILQQHSRYYRCAHARPNDHQQRLCCWTEQKMCVALTKTEGQTNTDVYILRHAGCVLARLRRVLSVEVPGRRRGIRLLR